MKPLHVLVIVPILGLALGSSAALAASAADQAKAVDAAAAGKAAMDAEQWPAAVQQFQAAYALDQHPAILWNLARAQEQHARAEYDANRPDAAHQGFIAARDHYRTFMATDLPDGLAKHRATAVDRIRSLDLEIDAARLAAEKRDLDAAIAATPPADTVMARPAATDPAPTQVHATSPPPADDGLLYAGVATLGVAVGAAILGGVMLAKSSDAEAEKEALLFSGHASPHRIEALEAEAKDAETIGIIGLSVAGATAITGGVLLWMWAADDAPADSQAASFGVGATPDGVSVSSTFSF